MPHSLPPLLLLSNLAFKASNTVFMTDNTVKTNNCTTSRFKVFTRGSFVSAIIMDARVATIGTSVTIKRLKQDVLGSNPCEKFTLVHSDWRVLKSHNQEKNKG